MSPDPVTPPADSKEAVFQRLLAEAGALSLKLRLRLVDALKSDAVLQREDGLRFSIESLGEYKRGRKRQDADHAIDRWIATFTDGDVFFDVGANTGSIALRTAMMHHGRVPVFAFEPAFDTFGALVRNISVNNLSHVITPLHVALFDETGIRPFHRSSVGAGTALHAVGQPLDYTRQSFTPVAVEPVLAYRLDDLISTMALPRPTRIKLDVDGFEDKVLAGAMGVLAASHCDVYIELVEATADDPHPQRVTRMLRDHGYHLAEVVEHGPAHVYPRIVDGLFVWG
jgi:FkbM family methyltransferase